jgi:tRNA 2-thiouridine synthesizing protein A
MRLYDGPANIAPHRVAEQRAANAERHNTMDHADYCLDATGLICPEPLMLVRNKVREMKAGEVVHVLATDPSTERDLTNFCRFMGHTMISQERVGATYHYRLRKG